MVAPTCQSVEKKKTDRVKVAKVNNKDVAGSVPEKDDACESQQQQKKQKQQQRAELRKNDSSPGHEMNPVGSSLVPSQGRG